MAKLKKMVSAVGSIKDLNSARAEFDNASRVLPDAEIYPPEEIRPQTTDARTLLLRITNPAGQQTRASQGDIFVVIHIPASSDFAAVLTINPSTQIESGQGRSPPFPMRAGGRSSSPSPRSSSAFASIMWSSSRFQRSARSSMSWECFRSTAAPSSLPTRLISSKAPITSTARQSTSSPLPNRSTTPARPGPAISEPFCVRSSMPSSQLDWRRIPSKGATVLSHFASGIHHDAALTILELGKIATSLRQLQADDIAVVTVPTTSRRDDEGTVIIDFDAEAMPALKGAMAGTDLPDFFRYLVSLGY